MQGDEGHGERLKGGRRRQAGVEQWVNEDGAEVLDEKDGAPWDLGAWGVFFRKRSQWGRMDPAGRTTSGKKNGEQRERERERERGFTQVFDINAALVAETGRVQDE